MAELKYMKATDYKFSIFNSPSPTPLPQGEGARGRVGFTLLEIMIALVIVGAVVIAILHTVNYHADVAYEQTITTTMLLMAKEKIAEMELKPENAEGTILGTNFTYENSVNTTEDDEIIELKTIISGNGKKIVLSELVLNKQIQKLK
jgi:type II secretion system protein I